MFVLSSFYEGSQKSRVYFHNERVCDFSSQASSHDIDLFMDTFNCKPIKPVHRYRFLDGDVVNETMGTPVLYAARSQSLWSEFLIRDAVDRINREVENERNQN